MTTTFAQPSLWEEQEEHSAQDANHFIKVIYFDGRRQVHRVGSPEWDAVSRDVSYPIAKARGLLLLSPLPVEKGV